MNDCSSRPAICLTALLERGVVAMVTRVKDTTPPKSNERVVDHQINPGIRWEWIAPKEIFMRIIALVLASALAVCFMDPASAATKRSAATANTDRSAYPSSANCGGSGYCYRSGSHKIQKHKK